MIIHQQDQKSSALKNFGNHKSELSEDLNINIGTEASIGEAVLLTQTWTHSNEKMMNRCGKSKKAKTPLKGKTMKRKHSMKENSIRERNEIIWNTRFQELFSFYQEHGHCNVPQAQGPLGRWVRTQRASYKKNKMNAERKKKLRSICFRFDIRPHLDKIWNEMFQQLLRYKETHGTCNVPQRQGSFGLWVQTQRKCYRKNKMKPERLKKLQSISFDFSFYCKMSKKSNKQFNLDSDCRDEFSEEGESNNNMTTTKESGTIARVQDLDNQLVVVDQSDGEIFYKVERILSKRLFRGKVQYLVKWYNTSETSWEPRGNLCDSALEEAEKKCEEAENIDVEHFESSITIPNKTKAEERWQKRLQELIEFKEKHGHFVVSRSTNKELSLWIQTQRRNENNMIEAHKKQLGDIGFTWSTHRFVITGSGKKKLKKKVPKAAKDKYETPNQQKQKRTKSKPVGRSSKGMNLRTGHFDQLFSGESPFDQNDVDALQVNNMTLNYVEVSNNIAPKHSFFIRWVGGRKLIHKVPIVGDMNNNEPGVNLKFAGRNHSLLARKVHRDSRKGSREGYTFRDEHIEFIYVATSGKGITREWNIEKELEKIADFRSLPPTKLIARLQLLLTPAVKPSYLWEDLTTDSFSSIEEHAHEGCGFIPEEMISKLLPRAHTKIDSLQVRIIGPCIGINKGMLFVKKGIKKIQIPPSMKKVNPSRCNKDKWVVVVAKGTFPTIDNRNLGCYLDPESNDPCKSFLDARHKKLSEMYQFLMKGLGIPCNVVEKYVKNSENIESKKHTHMKGVIDPTGLLPEGHIFVPGYISHKAGKNSSRKAFSECFEALLVSRSPAVEPTDMKMLPVVNEKPTGMPEETWDWLCGLNFGHIIFAMPRKANSVPLSKLVADGDLDGDDYLVCWDDEILNCMKHESVRNKLEIAERKQRAAENKKMKQKMLRTTNINDEQQHKVLSPTWFKDAQERMCSNLALVKDQSQLTGKLYSICHTLAESKSRGIFDKDAITIGRAYKESLDVVKHGGNVAIPLRLQNDIPEKFHECIDWK